MATSVMWFRRDLRLGDNPALAAAGRHAGAEGEVVALFCLDDRLRGPSGDARLAFLSGCLQALDDDAAMRQLLAEGWMHNRARMVVASFLVKDLHLDWARGARWFMGHLVDGDPASNQHGWQWVAGTGTDAAPYVRVFNPTSQGERCDPDGDYVRRYVPELRDGPGETVHRPWDLPEQPPGYPPRMVDHAEEREEALRRYEAARRGAR